MDSRTFFKVKIFVGFLILTVVVVAMATNSFYLAVAAILIGILFLFLVRGRLTKATLDERVVSISGMAAWMAYAVVTTFLAASGLFLIVSGQNRQDFYAESIGGLMSYISMLLLAIYSISYYYFNRKYGGDK